MAIELYKGRVPICRRGLDDAWLRSGDTPTVSTGCIPRDYDDDPVLMGDSPSGMKLDDPSEYDAIYDKGEEAEDSLEHLFLRGGKPAFTNLDQGPFPDCWFHSTAQAMMMDSVKQGIAPVPRLNAVAGATLTGMLGGGWCGKSMKYARDNGIPVMGTGEGEWPEHTRNKKYDTPAMRERMKQHKALENWYDLGRSEWDQVLSGRQIATCLNNNNPTPLDYNDFAHSILAIRQVRIAPGDWGYLLLGSWLNYGYFGLHVVAWSLSRPNNACSLRSSTPSAR